MSGTITLNGESVALTAATVEDLLRGRGIDLAARGLAVALNGAVVPKRDWPARPLAVGDRVEIVKPFAGG